MYDRFSWTRRKPRVRPWTLFAQSVGTDREGVRLTYADTNIESAGVPSDQKFGFRKLFFVYCASAVRDQAGYQLILDYGLPPCGSTSIPKRICSASPCGNGRERCRW